MKTMRNGQVCVEKHNLWTQIERNLQFLLLLPALLAMMPMQAWAADDPNDDTVILDGVSYHVLRNNDDWERFSALVDKSAGDEDVNAIMEADLSVTSWVGKSPDWAFRGIFNGNGHTLNVEINNPYNDLYMAPFVFASNATIRDLHVTGNVSGGKHSSGLVGFVGRTATGCSLTVERVWVSTTVTANDNSKYTGEFVGGFVGHARKNSIVMTDCRFDGKLISTCKSTDDDKERVAGAFVGWGEEGISYDLRRVYENGSSENINHFSICYWIDDDHDRHSWGGGDHPGVYTAHNWGECPEDRRNITDQQDLVNKMSGCKPDSWVLVDGKALPNIKHYSLDASFDAYDIVPATDKGAAGMLTIPFSCDQVVKWVDAWYTDENGQRKNLERVTLAPNSYMGFLNVPATEPHKDLQMTVRLRLDSISYTYDPKSDAVMHNPRNLKYEVLNYSKESLTDAGAIQLQWETKNPKYNDVVDGDQFIVLRSLTGKAEDMVAIGTVTLDEEDSVYVYKDSLLISALTKDLIVKETGIANLKYWVVRASAKQLWGMDSKNNPTIVTAEPKSAAMALLEPTDVKAAWSDETEHKAKVTWNFKSSDEAHYYVWDNRAQVRLEIKSYNRDGGLADSTVTVLTTAQLQAGEYETTLNRSCVNYQMQLYLDAKTAVAWSAAGDSLTTIAVAVPEDKFYHENLGRIDKESLAVRQLQSSVLLTWANMTDDPVDYYEVWRKEANETEFTQIATQLFEMQFEDKKVSPVHKYQYIVKGVNDCEGQKSEETNPVEGSCVGTGTVEGYLKFSDGTGIPGVTINITGGDGQPRSTKTDESGFFHMTDLPYVNGTETTYEAAPNLKGFADVKPITFSTTPGGNLVKGVEFEVKESVRFSGYVLYNGTSIPVQGVSFLVDGYEVHNASGKVVTDYEGKYSFHMLKNENHTIQAVKKGHVFYQDGYYHEGDDTSTNSYKFEIDKAGIYFYDDTRVKLIGRVAGGKDQAAIPLGNSLSRNNLGDDLQIVMALEGDKASRLVWDIQDATKKERDEVFMHKAHDKKYDYQTKVHTTINRMVITPDVHTGEYEVMLPPVKWKIQQISAKGYATLFQSGQVGDVIDLSDSLTLHSDTIEGSWMNAENEEVKIADVEYNAQYNRIYHSPVVIDYKQIGFDEFDYFGERYYNFKNVVGNKQKLTVAYGVRKQNWPVGKKDSLETKYTFGYPVFNIDRKYPVKISATERYYYNNNTKSDTIDIIRLQGGEVTIHNGMVSSTHRDVVELDSVGEAIYNLEAKQVPYLLTGPDALSTVSMTLEMDGTHYEAVPLKAYTFNIQQLKGAKDILSYSTPQLVDILRDPPGGLSNATLSKGSTMKYAYQMDMNWAVGTGISLSEGTGITSFVGVVAAPMGAGGVGGFNNSASSKFDISLDLIWSGSGQRAFSYTMTANQDISTSKEITMVGAAGDLYIGLEQNIIVKPATAIRAIPDSVFRQVAGQLSSGRMIEIANGLDDKGNTLHLVRDEVVTYGAVVTSDFIHSQRYIIEQLIPSLARQCKALLFTGTEAEAQQQADATGEPVYLSLVPADDENFGIEYKPVYPKEATDKTVNEVARYHDIMSRWLEMIAQNEKEKLEARDLVKNFSVDGGTTMSYGETFESNYSKMTSFVSPISSMTSEYFENGAKDTFSSMASIVGPTVAKLLGKILSRKAKNEHTGTVEKEDDGGINVEIKTVGVALNFTLTPVINFGVVPSHSEAKAYSRKESFTIAMDRVSHLDFDVYRAKTASEGLKGYDVHDVFLSNNFFEQTSNNEDYLKRELDLDDVTYSHSFVYRTRGGATCRPYEGERKTYVYNEGTVLDERTKKIENPVMKMDKQSLSGVPYGEPARFKLYMTNESEQPEGAYIFYNLIQAEMSNPDGAKIMMDGLPVTGAGRVIEIHPGQVTEKTLEVFAGEKFDYEGLTLKLISQGDTTIVQKVEFDVHYLQTAGAVTITTPGDKWIMNCDAPQEAEKGWYLPVIISGFDKNQHNFDHIEFQYKEQTRGDDYWTNLCGFYADSTIYAAASGTKEMIPENGNIITRFFGDGQVMEKSYDLRAVLFCRNGNNFLTNSSKVLTGVKDTRRPQLFGTPEPKDGILDDGDDIIFNFSEDIEYNYLQATTNFEVKGETNENTLQSAPSLQFSGDGYAQSEARRNFTDKDITIEVTIKPEETGAEMPIFSHGSEGKKLQLWLTDNKCLKVVVDDNTLTTTTPLASTDFQHVAFVLDNTAKKLSIYSDSLEATLDNVVYSGVGPLTFGSTNEADTTKRSFFKGCMMQGRVWNRALDINQLNTYAEQMLTGYEIGLIDYYPMNEGKGDYATDLAQGAHLKLEKADWIQPDGMSLRLDKTENKDIKGLQLKEEFFQRTGEQDYTLMLWFKTDEAGRGTLLSNGSGRKTDVGAENKFFIGFEGDTLKYRSNGQEYALGNGYSDDRWHHYTMTMNRSRKVVTIYVDEEMKAQFPCDSIGGMAGKFYLGNMVWQEEGADNDVVKQDNAFTGYIDGIALFEQALPQALISRHTAKSLGGNEKGLITYVDFVHQERQKNGDILLVPYVLNKKVKFDPDGNPSEQHDSVFVDPIDSIMMRVDRNIGAPIQLYEELRNLNFSFVGRDNQIMVSIDELNSRINKRTVYITVNEIPDMNGNFMASPVTTAVFVNRNPLRWTQKTYKTTINYGAETDFEFDIHIVNNSGAPHTYKVENMPKWLSVNVPSDIIDAQSEHILTFSIGKDINVGTYDNIIYLTDENGMAEPLMLDITVEGQEPAWAVSDDMKHFSMNIVARVVIEEDIDTDSRDIISVFDNTGRCMGVGNVNYNAASTESMAYLTVYDSTAQTKPLSFRLWHYGTGKTMVLTPSQQVYFKPEGFVGTTKEPLMLKATDLFVQHIILEPGWNWISLNVINEDYINVKKFLSHFSWSEGDMLTNYNDNTSLLYQDGEWISNKDIATLDSMMVSVDESYRIKVGKQMDIELTGSAAKSEENRTISVKQGWNSIGYTPLVNLPVSTALADYLDEAEDGDVVKSKTEFAMFYEGTKGSYEWKGNLKYMKPGEGYMIYRKRENKTSFIYPYFDANATFFEETTSTKVKRFNAYSNSMSLVATAEGIELQKGDKLLALAGTEVRGVTEVDELDENYLFFISIEGDTNAKLSFAIEREGEIIATTDDVITYKSNGIMGSPDNPTSISFVKQDNTQLPQSGWYTVQGVKLPGAPTRKGIYIYNGRKIMIN